MPFTRRRFSINIDGFAKIRKFLHANENRETFLHKLSLVCSIHHRNEDICCLKLEVKTYEFQNISSVYRQHPIILMKISVKTRLVQYVYWASTERNFKPQIKFDSHKLTVGQLKSSFNLPSDSMVRWWPNNKMSESFAR